MALVHAAPIRAVVKHIMDEKHGEYGPYQSVLFEGSGLQDGKLWRAVKLSEARQLCKDMTVELTPTTSSQGKSGWNIRPLSAHPAQPQQPQPVSTQSVPPQPQAQLATQAPTYQAQTTEKQRQRIESYIFSMANLHAVCHQAVEQAYVGKSASDEIIRTATSSVFISAERRFRLSSPDE